MRSKGRGGGAIDLRINVISLGSTTRENTTAEAITEAMDLLRRLVNPTTEELKRGLAELGSVAGILLVRELKFAGVLT